MIQLSEAMNAVLFLAELEVKRAEREKQEPVAESSVSFVEDPDGSLRLVSSISWLSLPAKGNHQLYALPPVVAPVWLTDTDFNRLYDEAGFDPNEMREAAEHMFNAIQSAVLRANGFDIQPAKGN